MCDEIYACLPDAIITILATLMGGGISAYVAKRSIALEYENQRKQNLTEKRYALACKIASFFHMLHTFVNNEKNKTLEMPSLRYDPEEEWEKMVALKDEIYPSIILLFGLDFLKEVDEVFQNISSGSHSENSSNIDEIDKFIEKVKTDFL